MLQGKRIGITGGAGFLGEGLVRVLAPQNEIVVLDVAEPAFLQAHPGVRFAKCDVRELPDCTAGLQGLDVVYHRAGLMGNVRAMNDPGRYYDLNVNGTLNVLQACVQNHVAKLLFDSTEAVYGTAVSSPVTEDQVPRPTSLYGATKLAAEHAVRLFDERYGLSTLTFRYCRTRDSHTQDAIWKLTEKILNGEAITLYDGGTPEIDFVHVSDVIAANVLGAASPIRNQVLNVSSGERISFLGMVSAIEELTGIKATSIGFEAPTRVRPTAEHLFGPPSFYLCVRKAQELMGWRPKVSIRECIAATVEMLKSRGKKPG